MADTAVQRFYRFQAYIYDSTRWTILHGRRRAAATLDLRPNARLLEVGCGTGLNFPYLLDYLDPHDGHLVGLDFSAEMLARAKNRINRQNWSNVDLVQADAAKMSFDRPFDAIFFGYSLTMIPDWPASLDRAAELLVPGGRIVVLDFSRFLRWGPLAPLMRGWLRLNHVETLRPYEDGLRQRFDDVHVNYWLGGYNFTAVGRRKG